jgi:hypothetical protein
MSQSCVSTSCCETRKFSAFSTAPTQAVPKQFGSFPRSRAEEPRGTWCPSAGFLRAQGVTPAYHCLHMQAKTLGTSGHLSEPPGRVGLEIASRAIASQ